MSARARRTWGAVLLGASISVTVVLGALSGASRQPTRATSALLVLLAGSFQLASVLLFSGIGRADPSLARAAVRRLLHMAVRASNAKQIAEANMYGATAADMRAAIGQMSVDLSWIEEGLLDAVEDWQDFHGEALKRLEEKSG